ncbi:unnamed protein product [Meloidogyne enterolobii]|uniref:Uncharacterized protein n=1 Tax=Meloidogyne enterolobii TaxID=390850 RepID=A0ACB1A176_MELEN
MSGKGEEEITIMAIDKNFWIGKTSVKVSDLEKSHNDIVTLEDSVNRALRHIKREVNQNTEAINKASEDANRNFISLNLNITELNGRVSALEDGVGKNEQNSELDLNENGSSNNRPPRISGVQTAGKNRVMTRKENIDDESEEFNFTINMLTSNAGIEIFGEESVYAFDKWAERFKDYLIVAGRNWTEQEKVARLRLALGDTPRDLQRAHSRSNG